MPLTTVKARVIGNKIRIFREGDAFILPSAGTAGQESKPGSGDTGWLDVGDVLEFGANPQRETREVWGPAPGQLKLKDIIETKRRLTLTFTLQDLSPFAYELLFGTAKLDETATTYTPLSAGEKRAWVEIKQRDNTDALVNTLTVFALLKASGEVKFNDQLATVPVEAEVLYSSVATGTL
jgi:hypothetical protein